MLKADEVYLAEDEFNIVSKLDKSELINMVNHGDAKVKLSEVITSQISTGRFGNVTTETVAQMIYLVLCKIKSYLMIATSCALIDINYAPDSTSLFILHE